MTKSWNFLFISRQITNLFDIIYTERCKHFMGHRQKSQIKNYVYCLVKQKKGTQ